MSEATHHDPRSIITPDAFEVSGGLLGMPLAKPSKRLLAMLVDLVAIGAITAATSSFGLVLGVVAAGFFMRAGFKRTEVRRSVFNRAMRLSVGCFGLFIGLVTAILWWSFGFSLGSGGRADDEGRVPSAAISALVGSPELSGVASGLVREGLRNATTLAEAEGAVEGLRALSDEMNIEPERLLEIVIDGIPEEASWAGDEAEERFAEIILGDAARADAETGALRAVLAAAVADAPIDEIFDAYRTLSAAEETDAEEELRLDLIRARLVTEIAADTLGTLADRIDDLESDNARVQRQLATTEAALEKETSGGFFRALLDFVDELGFGFGWAGLYMTIVLSATNGQTLGKKFAGIRVVRLDGEPITWWIAFERAGGYAAGFATGLLGFAQVYWDANRQAIHDRIVGTVVVVDGGKKVVDWESAL